MSPLAGYLLETLVTLAAVVVLAVLVLYGARRVGIGRPTGPLELVGRLPLDGRRAVYLVRVESTVYVLGASEAGLLKLGELDSPSEPSAPAPAAPKFGDVLKGVLQREPARKPVTPAAKEDGDESS
jgi:flagellar biogenesis protein FliO